MATASIWRIVARGFSPRSLAAISATDATSTSVTVSSAVGCHSSSLRDKPPWPAADKQTEPWFVIQAMADTDGDGEKSWFVAGSLNGEVYVENEGE